MLKLSDDDNSLRCSFLIPAGRKVEDLDYLSFKIGVPESMFSMLLRPELWPKGVRIRAFVPRTRVHNTASFLPTPARFPIVTTTNQ